MIRKIVNAIKASLLSIPFPVQDYKEIWVKDRFVNNPIKSIQDRRLNKR